MARSAPAVNGTPTFKLVSLRWIDATGDLRSDTLQLPTATTNAQIEAIADTISDISNAALYRIEVSETYNAVPDKNDAVDALKESVYDNLAILAKTPANDTRRAFIPAPEAGLFVAGTDQIDPTNADLAAFFTALLAPLTAAGYEIVSARYTERREINEAVRI